MLKRAARSLITLNKRILVFEKGAICTLLFTMLLLSLFQIIMRNVFSGGVFWIDHFLRMCVLWIAFVGASLASEYKRHIKIDVLSNAVASTKKKTILMVIAEVFAMFICLCLCVASFEYIIMISGSDRATIFSMIPDWWFRLVIPYAFMMMTLRAPLNIYRTVTSLFMEE